MLWLAMSLFLWVIGEGCFFGKTSGVGLQPCVMNTLNVFVIATYKDALVLDV